MINSSRAANASQRGQAVVEFALIMPILLSVLFGVAAFGLLFYSYVTMQLAVREGTSAIVHNPRQSVSQIQDTVRSYMVTLDRNQVNVVVEPSDPSQWVSGASVSVTGIYIVGLPVQALGPITLRAVSVMTVE